jgi:hypothetical protein
MHTCSVAQHASLAERWTDELLVIDGAPNGLAFSCRERAGGSFQKADDLAREAVNCNAVFGAPRFDR